MTPPQLVVFDMAGTTVRDEDAVNGCLRDALAAAGHASSREAVNEVMGLPKPLAIEQLLAASAGKMPRGDLVHQIHEDFRARMIDFYATSPLVSEMPDATRTFLRLRGAGVRIALDTGFSRPIVDVILRRLGWDRAGVLDATVSSDEVPRGRPHPDLILEAMRRTGVTEVRAVAKVGDTPSDLQEGTAAGCAWVVGLTHGTHTREELQRHPHTQLIAHLNELPEILAVD